VGADHRPGRRRGWHLLRRTASGSCSPTARSTGCSPPTAPSCGCGSAPPPGGTRRRPGRTRRSRSSSTWPRCGTAGVGVLTPWEETVRDLSTPCRASPARGNASTTACSARASSSSPAPITSSTSSGSRPGRHRTPRAPSSCAPGSPPRASPTCGAGPPRRPGPARAPLRAPTGRRWTRCVPAPTGEVLDAAFTAAGLGVPEVPRYPRVEVLWTGDAVPQPVAVVVGSNEPLWRSRPVPVRHTVPAGCGRAGAGLVGAVRRTLAAAGGQLGRRPGPGSCRARRSSASSVGPAAPAPSCCSPAGPAAASCGCRWSARPIRCSAHPRRRGGVAGAPARRAVGGGALMADRLVSPSRFHAEGAAIPWPIVARLQLARGVQRGGTVARGRRRLRRAAGPAGEGAARRGAPAVGVLGGARRTARAVHGVDPPGPQGRRRRSRCGRFRSTGPHRAALGRSQRRGPRRAGRADRPGPSGPAVRVRRAGVAGHPRRVDPGDRAAGSNASLVLRAGGFTRACADERHVHGRGGRPAP
jgi:hypothetical protein